MIRHDFFRVVFLLVFALPYFVASANADDDGIKEMLETVRKKHKVPSLTVAVVRSDKIETMRIAPRLAPTPSH